MTKESIRKRLAKRFRRIAKQNKVSNYELQKVWKSQFAFAKEKLEAYDKEELANASKEELEEIVINFLYLGKIHSSKSLQEFGNKKNKINGEKEEDSDPGE